MKKPTKKLNLATETIANLTTDALGKIAGGLMLTRPYTKLSVCAGGGSCATEVCN